MTLGGSYYFYTHFGEANSTLYSCLIKIHQKCEQVSAMTLVSIAERKQFRICKMQKRKNAKTQNYKAASKRAQ